MALQLNLLHEQLAEQRQRQRDPLKIGMMLLGAVAVLMLSVYLWRGYQTLNTKNQLAQVQRDWAKVEPKVTAAQKRSKELTAIIGTTKVLDEMMEGRFYWAPFLQKLSRCVAPNAQLTIIDGTVNEEAKNVSISIEGTAAGREPRAAAEELRQLLQEQLSQTYSEVKVEFRTLEDLDSITRIGGVNTAMARYALSVNFSSTATPPSKAPAAPRGTKKMTTSGKPTKDQIQKLVLSSIGFVVLLYVYFSFFLGPLNKSRETMARTMSDLQAKLGSSKTEMAKAASLEEQATAATSRFAALQALSPEGAPIAWFPPRIKLFFANQQIEKAGIRPDSNVSYKQPELAGWLKYGWLIELPQTDFITVGKAIAELENAEPLLSISHLSMRAGAEDPQFQQVNLTSNVAIVKR